MFPVQWSANVKLPFYGWFGESGFSTERDARGFVAMMLWRARRDRAGKLARPSYAGRCYTIRRHVMTIDDIAA